jgi:hypothetical protein
MLNLKLNNIYPTKTIGNIVYLFCQIDDQFMSTTTEG